MQGQSGNAVQYVTRNQALKKLQLKLSEFRRLCILKGIHPREPRKKTQGAHKTYYHVKDVSFLLHEPLLKKVRELAAYDKKIRKASAKKNRDLARRLASRRPGYRLDHLVRERYPSFIDALRDIDDALTLIHLFAVLPAEMAKSIPSERVQLSRRLALEWQAWVARAGALRKAFVSVKGFYFQAEVRGQEITWLVPHQTSQVLPPDVDFKVMSTFLELYHTTLQFVLYKLYTESGLKYPPVMDEAIEAAAGGACSVLTGNFTEAGDATTTMMTPGGEETDRSAASSKREAGSQEAKANPQAEERMKTLSKKVAELEEEIRTIDNPKSKRKAEKPRTGENLQEPSNPAEDLPSDDEQSAFDDSEDESDEFTIDSGDEEDEDGEDESGDESSDVDDGSQEDEDGALRELRKSSNGDNKTLAVTSPSSSPALPEASAGAPASTVTGGAASVDDDDIASVCSTLFQGLVFFLGREVPREQLLLVIRSFGGQAGWSGDGSPLEENDGRITHQIVDRPAIPRRRKDREYVQPQWVFDSANARVLVRTSHYQPGSIPPPHLSPFVDPEAEGYEPEYAKEIRQLQEAARQARKLAAGNVLETAFLENGPNVAVEGEGNAGNKNNEDFGEYEAEKRYVDELQRELGVGVGGAKTVAGAEGRSEERSRHPKRGRNEDLDEEEMKDIMMTRKVRRAYQKARAEERAKKERAESLKAKAAAIREKQG